MYLENLTNNQIVLTEVLSGQDLEIPAGGKTNEFIPNKKVLEKILINHESLEVHVTRGSEISAITEIDPRFETILVLD